MGDREEGGGGEGDKETGNIAGGEEVVRGKEIEGGEGKEEVIGEKKGKR